MDELFAQLKPMLPVLTVLAGAALTALVGAFSGREGRRALPVIGLTVIALAAAFQLNFWLGSRALFFGAVKPDPFSSFVGLIVLAGGAVTLFGRIGPEHGVSHNGDTQSLLLAASAGLMLLPMCRDLATLFVALELAYLPITVMVGLGRHGDRGLEGSVKAFTLNLIASGSFLFGASLMFGVTGTTAIAPLAGEALTLKPVAVAAMGFMVTGLLLKVGAAPFHLWHPDAQEGASAPVSAFIAGAAQAGALAALLRLLLGYFSSPELSAMWWRLAWGLALLALVIGAVLAVYQRHLKRMLSYLGLFHVGLALAALTAHGAGLALAATPAGVEAIRAILFSLAASLFAFAGAYVVIASSEDGDSELETLDDVAGLARQRPWTAAALAVFFLSIGGFPPFAGFLSRFLIFKAALQSGSSAMALLVTLSVVLSVVALYPGLRVLGYVALRDPQKTREPVEPAWGIHFALFLCSVATLVIGLFPSALLRFATSAAFVLSSSAAGPA